MAITFGWVGTDYDNASYEAVTPAGSGGIIVAITAGNGGEPSPATPADWNELTISVGASEVYIWAGYWAIADNNPDMTFNKSGSGEAGIYTWRIPDADVTSPEVYVASLEATFTSTLAIAQPNRSSMKGDQVGLVGLQASGARTLDSTSAGWVEDKDGYIGIAEWWAGQAAAIHYEGYLADYGSATIGGGVLDTGSTAAIWVKAAENVIATDDFNRANEVLDTSANWSQVSGTSDLNVVGNAVQTTNVTGQVSGDTWQTALNNDHWVEIDVTLGGGTESQGGVVVRTNASGYNGYFAFWSSAFGGYYGIFDRGAFSTIAQTATGQGNTGTKKLRLEAVGSQITLYVDGVETLTVSDASETGDYVGISTYVDGTTPTLDNFRAGDWTTPSDPPLTADYYAYDFAGVNGADWSSEWYHGYGGQTTDIFNNKGRQVPDTTSYATANAQYVGTAFGHGGTHDTYIEFQCDTSIIDSGITIEWNASGGDYYSVYHVLSTGLVYLDRVASYSATTKDSGSLSVSGGDLIKIRIKSDASTGEQSVFMWKNADPEPSVPVVRFYDPSPFTAEGMGLRYGRSTDLTPTVGYWDNLQINAYSGPNVIATDDFNRANEALSASTNWTAAWDGSPNIVSNVVQAPSINIDAAAIWTGDTFDNDQWAEIDASSIASSPLNNACVGVRMNASGGYVFAWEGAVYFIYEVSASGATFTTIASTPTTLGGARRLRLEAVGNLLTAYVDGVEVLSVTDNNWASGSPGVNSWYNSGSSSTIDNFSAGDWTTPSATAPSAVSDLSATPGNAQVELTWTAPADGGSAITDYEYRVDGGTWTSIGSTTPGYTVISLTNGVSYDFEVRAVNAVGSAAASNLVSATPVAVNVPTLLDGTSSGSNTAANPQNVAYPAHNVGDLIVQSIAVDANVSPTIPATGPGGETIITIVDNVTPSTAGPHFSAWAFIANATRAAGDLSVSMSAIEQTSSEAFRVAAGDFDPTDPIPDISTAGLETNGTTGQMNMPSFTASVANGRVVMMGGVDADPMTATFSPAGWTDFIDHDVGAVSSCVAFRDAGTTVSETIAAATFGVNTGDTNSCIGFVIAPYTGAAPTYLLKLGDLSVTAMYLGDLAVSAAYLGDVQVL